MIYVRSMHLPLRFLTSYYRFKKHMDYNSQTKGRFVVRMGEKWAAQTHANIPLCKMAA